MQNVKFIVVTSSIRYDADSKYVSSFSEALAEARKLKLKYIYVIGGERIYEEASQYANHVILTRIYSTYICDKHFNIEGSPIRTSKVMDYNGLKYQHLWYGIWEGFIRMPFIPSQSEHDITYNELVKLVLGGVRRKNRTGIDTLSVFGTQSRYDLRIGLPILTTKKIYVKGIIEELLWMMRGSTDVAELQTVGVNFWNANSTREFLDKAGLTWRENDIGPAYGHAFRHYGALYDEARDYSSEGFDQIAYVIELLKNNPDSRRIVISLWNPMTTCCVALPPCHVLYQFDVDGDILSCSMYQRSGDIGLGVPFNIVSASLLTHMLAAICGLQVGELIHTIGSAHIYINHVDALTNQLSNFILAAPQLDKLPVRDDPSDYTIDDFKIYGQLNNNIIKMDMA
jgi:thymidylate synthase